MHILKSYIARERDLLVKKSGNLDVKKCRNINETQLYFNDFSVCSRGPAYLLGP